jgi:hypothetical protein
LSYRRIRLSARDFHKQRLAKWVSSRLWDFSGTNLLNDTALGAFRPASLKTGRHLQLPATTATFEFDVSRIA